MRRKNFLNWMKNKEQPTRHCYIPFRDSEGNLLYEDEIYFMDEKTYEKHYGRQQRIEVWDREEKDKEDLILTVNTPGVRPIYDDKAGNFPIALEDKDGRTAYLKVSKPSGELLALHAGCCRQIKAVLVAGPSSGKTIYTLQVTDPKFRNMLAKYTTCSISDELPYLTRSRKNYEEARRKMKKENVLPESSKRGEKISPYSYYVQYRENGEERRALLTLQDFDGESCSQMAWEGSRIFHSNFIILMIGADELMEAEDSEPQYVKVVEQLLPRLSVLKNEKNYAVQVLITKADCLDQNNEYLREALRTNTVCMENGNLRQTVHARGFDEKAYKKHSDAVEQFLKVECSGIYNQIMNVVPRNRISFGMIASIGEQCRGNHFENYRPYCVDLPLVSVLAGSGLYPIAAADQPHEEEVKGYTSEWLREMASDLAERFREWMGFYDDDWDEEEEWEDE